ncbi:MAG: adenylate/guanylate cyclase domain-containing protein [Candidatus Kapaibacterium sp.]
MKKFIWIVVLLMFGSSSAMLAQKKGQERIDSLLAELPKAQPDTNKALLLSVISFAYYELGAADSTLRYAKEIMALSRQLSWKTGIAKGYSSFGFSYELSGDGARAMEFFEKAYTLYSELNNRDRQVVSVKNMYRTMNQPSSTPINDKFIRTLEASPNAKTKQLLGDCNSGLGAYYFMQKIDYPRALYHYQKAVSFYRESGDTSEVEGPLSDIGSIYYFLKDYTRAIEYFETALSISEKKGKQEKVFYNLVALCEIYKYRSADDRTLKFCFSTLRKVELAHRSKDVVVVLRCIGEVYRKQHHYRLALAYCRKALERSNGLNDVRTEVLYAKKEIGLSLLESIGDTMHLLSAASGNELSRQDSSIDRYLRDDFIPATKQAQLHLAERYLTECLSSPEITFQVDVAQDCYEGLIKIYQLTGDYRKEAELYRKYTALKDSTFSSENSRRISALEAQRIEEVNAKRQEISNLGLERARIEKFYFMGGIFLLMCMSGLLYNRYRLKSKANVSISNEKARSEALLLNILPAEVADELKSTGTAQAKHFNNVTVLFTDFKNFTTVSEQLSPQELVDELHACFKGFDEICSKHTIEKIKTIGDAYLAVCGLPQADEHHAEHVVHAALEIREFMLKRRVNLGEKTFEIRIGINSGSVVAGIVGVKKFAYDIWGDTVNTAARMEQNSEPGKINISETTYALVKDRCTCEYRGEIDAKNKGKLKMYFVEKNKKIIA